MKRTAEDMRAEFHRLYDIFEAIEDAIHNHDGSYWTTGFGRLIHSRAAQLDRVAQGEFPLGEIVLGTKQAISSATEQVISLLQNDTVAGGAALARYRAQRGRDYWDDVAPPKKLLSVILKRGCILDVAERRWLTARLADSATPLRPEDAVRVRGLLAEFAAAPTQQDAG